ncbi:hypothetical protein [Algoriphagus persicinus]|uniref:hypothetical protein n=1 Tax=Algoriphagus persicinus TaxID=3108754 RepID=UPI002B3C081D|nr:hypothetical protein [Algoriphagus sp. E1-3-M2]MEB2786382.1 hypothetical protein [Algoriphagus sp. E1-3-M2]
MKKSLIFLEYWEKFYPYILSIIFIIIIYKYIPSELEVKIFSSNIFDSVLTLSGISFGFLITVLSLLLQMTNRSLKMLKELDKFDLLISYNKQAVYNSALTMIFSLILLIMFSNENITPPISSQELILGYIWLYLILCMIVNTYRYTSLFFKIVRS